MKQTTFVTSMAAAAALILFAGPGVARAQSREGDNEHGRHGERGRVERQGRDDENDDLDDENDNDDDDDRGSVSRTATGTGQCVDVNGRRYCDDSRGSNRSRRSDDEEDRGSNRARRGDDEDEREGSRNRSVAGATRASTRGLSQSQIQIAQILRQLGIRSR